MKPHDLKTTRNLLADQFQTGPVKMGACASRCGRLEIDSLDCEECLSDHLATLIGLEEAEKELANHRLEYATWWAKEGVK